MVLVLDPAPPVTYGSEPIILLSVDPKSIEYPVLVLSSQAEKISDEPDAVEPLTACVTCPGVVAAFADTTDIKDNAIAVPKTFDIIFTQIS